MSKNIVSIRQTVVSGTDIALLPTGELMIGWHVEGNQAVRLTPEATYALLVFLRQPGVADLIEQQEAARQEQDWHEYEEDPEYPREGDAE